MIEIKFFSILNPGDTDAGINSSSWTLGPDFFFEDKEDLDLFREELKQLFINYTGDTRIQVITNIDIEEEEKLWERILE